MPSDRPTPDSTAPGIDRRQFLAAVGTGAVAATLGTGAAAAEQSCADGPFHRTYAATRVSTDEFDGFPAPGDGGDFDGEFPDPEEIVGAEEPVSEETYRELKRDAADDTSSRSPQPAPVPGPSLSVTASFDGLGTTETRGYTPSDAQVAAGPDHVLQAVNMQFAVYDRDTGEKRLQVPFSQWWESEFPDRDYPFGFPFAADPRVRYDRDAGRFVVAASWFNVLERRGALLLSVSDGDDPLGTWTNYEIPPLSNRGIVDYPRLGVGPDALYLLQDLIAEQFGGVSMVVLDKDDCYAGRDADAVHFTNLRNPDGSLAHIVQPALQATDDSGGPFYLCSSQIAGGDSLTLWEVTDPTTDPAVSCRDVEVPAYRFPPHGQQPDTDTVVDTLDNRLMNLAYDPADGTLWTAHATGVGGTAAIQWYELDPSKPGNPVRQHGLYGEQGRSYCFPTVGTNGDTTVLCYNVTGPDTYPRMEVAGRPDGFPRGQLSDSVVVQAGGSAVHSRGPGVRWGDYNGVAVDPVNPDRYWCASQYSPAADALPDRYDTRIAQVAFDG